ncbi:peptidylprolyl isomerase [Sphingomonas sp. ac-8]|uniref:peptidylprolyl isomerase n=1 Tax=Sphingomonas sp. ac-8 TaxID=3242977 RepID=UPI003A805CBA
MARCAAMLTALLPLALLGASAPQAAPAPPSAPASPTDPLAADWRPIPDDELLVLTLSGGRQVVIRLTPDAAPVHVANIRALARAHWWDGTSVYRVQDNYVAQWGDVTEKKPLPAGVVANPPAEYGFATPKLAAMLARPDAYARHAGFTAQGWPVASGSWRDGSREAWLPHCYAMVGVARDLAPSTGSGAELYTVIGHAPRQLDRNIALVGRVIEGIERLSTLPRGTGELGFYEREDERVPIVSVRLASDLPEAQRPRFDYRAADNPRFAAYVADREHRQPPFFTVPAGGADICNVAPQVRRRP